jgi:SAM-dependent methyltransferase
VIIRFLILILMLMSCQSGQDKQPRPSASPADSIVDSNAGSTKTVQDDDRSNWQKPSFVIQSLGDLEAKTLADIGSGALGYFVFKILGQTDIGKLIAIDIDKEAVRMLNILKDALAEEKASKLDIRLADINDPKLDDEETDYILIVNTIAYLPDRINYLKALKSKLRAGGKIVIVDYKTKRIPGFVDAPPYEERVLLHIIEEELYEAGYQNIITDDTSLEYQYYIAAEI